MEKLGDARLESALVDILLRKYPLAEPGDLNGMITHYRSNEIFASILTSFIPKLGSSPYFEIVEGVPVSAAVKADIFEALFGALYQAAESIVRGLADVYIVTIFEGLLSSWLIKTTGRYAFDERLRHGPSSSQYGVIFKSVQGKPKVTTVVADDYQSVTVTVPVGAKQIEYINSRMPAGDPKIPSRRSNYEFTATAPTKEAASREAYQKALDWLAGYGVDVEWADRVKYQNILAALPNAKRTRLLAKLAREGYVEARIGKLEKHTIEGHQTVNVLKGLPKGGIFYVSLAIGVGKAPDAPGLAIDNYLRGEAIEVKPSVSASTSRLSRPEPFEVAAPSIYDEFDF